MVFLYYFLFLCFFNNKIRKTDGRKGGEDKGYVFCKHVSCWFCVNITQTENNKTAGLLSSTFTQHIKHTAHKMQRKGNEYIITYTQ